MKLTFLGTRGYIGLRTPRHRMHTASMVSWRGKRIMLDCGEDWLARLPKLKPDAIVVTHPHPDHVFGLKRGSPCPVYAIEAAWEKMAGLPIEPAHRRTLRLRRPARIGDLMFEPFSVVHSVQAPAVGYRITAGNLLIFYVPDVVQIPERSEALAGIRSYIGDGATITRPLVRKEKRTHQLIGHTTIREQLAWCKKEGVSQMIVTHCGSAIVGADEKQVTAQLDTLGRESGVDIELAYDGMEVLMRG
jgi:phosphoribosyl 1,2-cyclic phosphodiesterase